MSLGSIFEEGRGRGGANRDGEGEEEKAVEHDEAGDYSPRRCPRVCVPVPVPGLGVNSDIYFISIFHFEFGIRGVFSRLHLSFWVRGSDRVGVQGAGLV